MITDEIGKLTFGTKNAKLPSYVATFTIPAGRTCPGALECKAWVGEDNRIHDGKHQKFRCFEASLEVAFRSVRVSAKRNWDALKRAKTVEGMANLISLNLPPARFHTIRVHVGGDFYNESYFLAWMMVAARHPDRRFYAYTKSVDTWVKFRNMVPGNFTLTASRGGRHDHLIGEHNLREAVVIFHPEEANGLPIDHDDSCAMNPDLHRFALLIHGVQPKDSEAAEAVKRLRREDVKFSYARKKKTSTSVNHV